MHLGHPIISTGCAPRQPPRPGRAPRPGFKGDVVEALSAVAAAMAAGEISPDEAAAVVGVIDVQRKGIELIEVNRRLNLLERQMQER